MRWEVRLERWRSLAKTLEVLGSSDVEVSKYWDPRERSLVLDLVGAQALPWVRFLLKNVENRALWELKNAAIVERKSGRAKDTLQDLESFLGVFRISLASPLEFSSCFCISSGMQAWAKRDLHGQGGVLEELQRLLLWWGVFMDFESLGTTNDFAATVFYADDHLIISFALLIIWRRQRVCLGVYFDHHRYSHMMCQRRAHKWGYAGLDWTLEAWRTSRFFSELQKKIFEEEWRRWYLSFHEIFLKKEISCLCLSIDGGSPTTNGFHKRHSWRREPPSMDRSSCLSFLQSFA